MTAVNNFITDLLDRISTKDGSRLLLEEGSRPRVTIDGRLETAPGSEIVEQDELLYDLESLGITGISADEEQGEFSFRYQPENSPKPIRFELSHYIDRGLLHVDIIMGKQHDNILIDLLDNMEREQASTLLLSGDNPPYYSIGGNTAPVQGYGPVSVEAILAELQDMGVNFADGNPKDFAYRAPAGVSGSNRFRVNAEFKNGRINAVFRLIPDALKPLVW